MPRKLKVAFCNGADDTVHSAFRDMGFMANLDGTFTLRIAGGLGGGYKMGVLVDEHVPATEILYYIRAMRHSVSTETMRIARKPAPALCRRLWALTV